MEDGLDGEHGAHERRRRGNAPAAPQVVEVKDREPVADLALVLLEPGGVFRKAHAGVAVVERVVRKQALAHGGAEAVHDRDGPLGVAGLQLLRGEARALVRSRERRGKGEIEHVLPGFQDGRKVPAELLRVDLRGSRGRALAQLAVELLAAHGLAEVVQVFLAADVEAERDDGECAREHIVLGQIGAAIGKHPVCHGNLPPFFSSGCCFYFTINGRCLSTLFPAAPPPFLS